MDILTYLNEIFNIEDITKYTGDNKVFYQKTKNPKDTYCTYLILKEKNAYSDEDEELITEYLIQIDIFSNSNYTQLLKAIKKQLKNNDFYKDEIVDTDDDFYKYHKVLRYYKYLENND